ncbi:MAG: TonB-dependent receptor plug domain-containing protein [Saprospiraceae bacterium]|nr:TonB-dependent receptor plug domain-containing protein [Saprospiraceae bacterium]
MMNFATSPASKYLPVYLFFAFFSVLSTPLIADTFDFEYEITVVDPTGQPLPGVNVVAVDGSFQNITDVDGKLLLTNASYSTEYTFSYIGFKTQTLPFYKIRQFAGRIVLQPSLEDLPTVIVVGRRDEKPQEIPYKVGTISAEQIAFLNSQTTADALMQNEQVFVQKSQMGGGSINIRGFEANKVLLVVDGVRLNNIIYRAGHLQDAIKVDPNMLQQMEVFYGPGSLNYGSDALGGVVHFRTKDPELWKPENGGENHVRSTNAMIRYSTANQEKTAHVDFNFGGEKWGSLTSFNYSKFEDLRAGANRPDEYPTFGSRERFVIREDGQDKIFLTRDTNIQTPTGYTQFDIMQKIKFQPNKNQYFLLNLQYSNTTDIPRYDFLQETHSDGSFVFSEWYYGPQQRMLASLKSQTYASNSLFNKMTIIGAVQRVDEDRYERELDKLWRQYTLEDVYVLSLTADFDKRIGTSSVLTYGVDVSHNILYSEAGQVNVETEELAAGVMTRYPSGGSDMTLAGAYTNLRWQSQDSIFGLFGGLRYTWAQLYATYEDNPSDPFRYEPFFYTHGFQTVNSRLTWSLGGTINTKDKWELRAMASTAFHAPNIDDFAKYRVRNFFVRVPNPGLKPEETINGEVTIGKEIGSLQAKSGFNSKFSGSFFYTKLFNAMVEQDFYLNGDPTQTTLFNENDGNEYRVRAIVNEKEAFIVGGSVAADFSIGSHWDVHASAGLSKGRVLEDGETAGYLDHIPPLFGRAGITYQKGRFQVAYVFRFNGEKPVEEYGGGEDNIENATPDGTYAWQTHNLYSKVDLFKGFSLDVGVENILDFHYRPFSSGVSAPGRNFIVALRGNF